MEAASTSANTGTNDQGIDTSPANTCPPGTTVTAIFKGNGQEYGATIESENSDGTFTVNWEDGDTGYRNVLPAHVRKGDKVCEYTSQAATPSCGGETGMCCPERYTCGAPMGGGADQCVGSNDAIVPSAACSWTSSSGSCRGSNGFHGGYCQMSSFDG